MVKITVQSWKPGFNKVQFNKLLRGHVGYSLSEAKFKIDQLLEGHQFEVNISSEGVEEFRARAEKLGAVLE